MDFIPNWKKLKFKDKIEGWNHVIAELVKNKKSIISRGVTDEISFTLWGETFILKNKNTNKKGKFDV